MTGCVRRWACEVERFPETGSAGELMEISLSGVEDDAALRVVETFDRWGWGGAVVEQILGGGVTRSVIKTYLPAEKHETLRQIEIGLALLNEVYKAEGRAPLPPMQTRSLGETDWAEAWKANYHPLRIGRHLVVKPTWCDYTPRQEDVIVELDPGMAFGSGLHPTTRLCLELLEDTVQPGARVLDVGTGSGILAIAAGKLQASLVLGLDIDPLAVRVAHQNVALNGLESVVEVREGTLETGDGKSPTIGDATWDVIVVNILAEPIIEMSAIWRLNMAAGGVLITSGIIAERADAVIASLRQAGLTVVKRRDDAQWVALTARGRKCPGSCLSSR